MRCSPAAFVHHQRGWEDAALEPQTETAGDRAQREEPGHHRGLEQGGRDRDQPLRHQGELGTRANDASGYLMPRRLTWSLSSHSWRLITHYQ